MAHEAFCLNPLHPGPCRGPRRSRPPAPTAGRARVGDPPAPVPAPRKAAKAAKRAAPAKAAPGRAAAPGAPQGPRGAPRGVAAPAGQNTPANRAASDAGAVAQILMGGGGDVTPQFVEGLMKRVRQAHQRDQAAGRGGPDSDYAKVITEESLAMAQVLANRGGGTPAERRMRRNRYANLISEAMRTGNPVPARTLRRELDGARTASAVAALDGEEVGVTAPFVPAPGDAEPGALGVIPLVPFGFGHTDCGMSTFCRNPLHPGPCKGWKKGSGGDDAGGSRPRRTGPPAKLSPAQFEAQVPKERRLYRGVSNGSGAAHNRDGGLGSGDYGRGVYFGRHVGVAQNYAQGGQRGSKAGVIMRGAISEDAVVKAPPQRVRDRGSAGIDKWADENGVDVVDLGQFQVVRNPAVITYDTQDYTLDESAVLADLAEGYDLDVHDPALVARVQGLLDGSVTAAGAWPGLTPLNTALAHFGLRQMDLEVYGEAAVPFVPWARAHRDCGMSAFCRNPLHPGPCKGWKNTLAKVAPGALKIIEEERLRKVREKREAREKERGGGGKKPATPPKKRTPKPKPEPKPANLVELRPETLALINDTARGLPQGEEGWARVLREPGTRMSSIDSDIADYESQMVVRQEAYDKALKKAQQAIRRGYYGPRSRAKLTPEQEQEAVNAVRWHGSKDAQEYVSAMDGAENLRKMKKEMLERRANGTATPMDGVWLREVDVPGPEHYERDPNGVRLPPPALREAEARVRAAGAALADDIGRAFAADPEARRLEERRQALGKELLASSGNYGDDAAEEKRRRIRAEITKTRKALTERRKALTLDALNQVRPVGSARTSNVAPGGSSELVGGAKPARADWRARQAVVDQHFPDDWIAAADRSPLTLVSSDRAFHRSAGVRHWNAESDPALRGSTIAMNTDRDNYGDYVGGYADYVDEVNVHEMGHRMEAQIPGIKALEYAFIRARTTKNGKVERRQKLSALTKNYAYGDSEIAYKDEFSEPYTGKTYEYRDESDPANQPWEVFQVGLQQTYGRSRVFDTHELEDFTLGVLATVGRSDL